MRKPRFCIDAPACAHYQGTDMNPCAARPAAARRLTREPGIDQAGRSYAGKYCQRQQNPADSDFFGNIYGVLRQMQMDHGTPETRGVSAGARLRLLAAPLQRGIYAKARTRVIRTD